MILLGSSRLLLQKGLTESLAGRFEMIYLGHWSFNEMQNAFGWDANQYVWFGGYPGSAILIQEEERWKRILKHGRRVIPIYGKGNYTDFKKLMEKTKLRSFNS